MNKVLPLLMMLTLAACAPPTRWEKPGGDALTAQRDQAECRGMSAAAANRIFSQPPPVPWAGSESYTPYTGYRMSSGNMWLDQPYAGEDRYATDSRYRVWCLRKRGYVEVPAVPTAAPSAALAPVEKVE